MVVNHDSGRGTVTAADEVTPPSERVEVELVTTKLTLLVELVPITILGSPTIPATCLMKPR